MATVRDAPPPSEVVLERIDAIVRELLALREAIAARPQPAPDNLAAELFGALGHGTWDEYDLQTDWRLFES